MTHFWLMEQRWCAAVANARGRQDWWQLSLYKLLNFCETLSSAMDIMPLIVTKLNFGITNHIKWHEMCSCTFVSLKKKKEKEKKNSSQYWIHSRLIYLPYLVAFLMSFSIYPRVCWKHLSLDESIYFVITLTLTKRKACDILLIFFKETGFLWRLNTC